MKAIKVAQKKSQEVVVEGIRILRNYPKSKLAKRAKNNGYRDWKKVLETMKKGDIAIVESRNLWHSAAYQAKQIGVKIELFRFDDEKFAIYRHN